MTCWKLQLSKKIYVSFKEHWNPLRTHYKTNKQKRTTQLSCWHHFMRQYWPRLPTSLHLGIRICFSVSKQAIFPVALQVSVFHEAQIFRFSKCLFVMEMFWKIVPISVEKLYLLRAQLVLLIPKTLEKEWYQPLKVHKAAMFAMELCWDLNFVQKIHASGGKIPPCLISYALQCRIHELWQIVGTPWLSIKAEIMNIWQDEQCA